MNDSGHVIGQDHHRAKFSDHEVDLMIALIEDGLSYREVAEKFETSKGFVWMLANGQRRGHTAVGQKTLRVHRKAPRFTSADADEFDLFT